MGEEGQAADAGVDDSRDVEEVIEDLLKADAKEGDGVDGRGDKGDSDEEEEDAA